jgi:transcription antitermination factor NusG
MAWHVFKVITNKEFEVAERIRQRLKSFGYDKAVKVIAPVLKKNTIFSTGRDTKCRESIYPGYILVDFQNDWDQVYGIIRNTYGVIKYIDGVVTEQEVEHTLSLIVNEVMEIKVTEEDATYIQKLKEKFRQVISERRVKNAVFLRLPMRLIRRLLQGLSAAECFARVGNTRRALDFLCAVQLVT